MPKLDSFKLFLIFDLRWIEVVLAFDSIISSTTAINMIPCSNKEKGCPKRFQSIIGLRNHIDICKYARGKSVKPSGLANISNSTFSGITNFIPSNPLRLQCDFNAFASRGNEEDEEYIDVVTLSDVYNPSAFENYQNPQLKRYRHLQDNEVTLSRKLSRIASRTGQKDVNEIMKLLQTPHFNLERFLSTFRSAEDCNEMVSSELQILIRKYVFEKRSIRDNVTGILYDVYIRSPISVLIEQIKSTQSSSTYFNPPFNPNTKGENYDYCHPMMTKDDYAASEAVKKAIINSPDRKEYWRTPIESGEASFVGMVQLYSDKSKTSLKESSFVFHPIHMTLLNFSEAHRRDCIGKGLTFTAFLPVKFSRVQDGNECEMVLSREIRLRLIHNSLKLVFQELTNVAYEGFRCNDIDGKVRRCHPCLAAYCCDLPEGKDMTSVKNGNTSLMNCHVCTAPTSQFHLYSNYPVRDGEETRKRIKEASELKQSGKSEEAAEKLKEYSLSWQIPWILNLPFIGIHASLNLHILFTYEVLHNLYLGLSKNLKRLLAERLKDEYLFTSNVPTPAGNYRSSTFKSIRLAVLRGINRMIRHINFTTSANGFGIRIASNASGSGNCLYSHEDGSLVGMLEGKDYKLIDTLYPFIGMFVDRCCNEEAEGTTTKVCVEYINIVQTSTSCDGNTSWNEEKVRRLETMIKKFKTDAFNLYGKYHASGLRTEKFHLLDHIPDDIRRLGGLRWGDASLFEHSHTIVKAAYRSGSKRKTTDMDDTMYYFMKDLFHSNKLPIASKESNVRRDRSVNVKRKQSTTASDSIQSDSASLVRKSDAFELHELENCRNVFRRLRKAKEERNQEDINILTVTWQNCPETLRDIVNDVGEDGTRVFLQEVKLSLQDIDATISEYKASRVFSGNVAGRDTPCSDNYNQSQTSITMQANSNRVSQRVVSGKGFHSKAKIRQDCVQIAGTADDGTEEIWIGKVLGLFHLFPKRSIHTQGSETAENNKKLELAFVQYFEVQPLNDRLDKILGCVRLRWARECMPANGDHRQTTRESRTKSASTNITETYAKWFGLIPVESLRGVVHVVRGDYGLNGRGIVSDMDSVAWYKRHFYINRFFFDRDEKIYHHHREETVV